MDSGGNTKLMFPLYFVVEPYNCSTNLRAAVIISASL